MQPSLSILVNGNIYHEVVETADIPLNLRLIPKMVK